jgi:uncharacterized protein (DUF2147 family)
MLNMNEAKPADSRAWIWILAVAMIICLAALACVGFFVFSLVTGMSRLVEANAMPTDSVVIHTAVPPYSTATAPVATVTAASITTAGAPVQDSDFVGLWQYPDRWVWIEITPEGQAFQCRIATDRTVYRSQGVLAQGDRIIWEEVWGVDSIRKEAGNIVLDGQYGEFEYVPTAEKMDPVCGSPF